MKRFSTGFSLAEVLIALGIISVIATLGFTISKKGVERAYDGYIYTGVSSISAAIADANANIEEVKEDNFIDNLPEYSEYIRGLMNAGVNGNVITAPNGITFELSEFGEYSESGEAPFQQAILIKMTVPIKKRGNQTSSEYNLLYLPNTEYPLIPYNPETRDLEPIADRPDLLAYYRDDGRVGRYDPMTNLYNPITYGSFREIACAAHGTITLPNFIQSNNRGGGNGVPAAPAPRTVLNCNGVPVQGGSVILENPRKAF